MQSKSPIQVPQKLASSYRRFYRANKRYNPSTSSVLKPMFSSREIIQQCRYLESSEDLIFAIAGAIEKDMRQVRASTAGGYWVIADRAEERLAILDFARLYVEQVYIGLYKRDRSTFSSEKQIGVIEDTVEMLYRIEQDKENQRLLLEGEDMEQPEARLIALAQWELSEPDEDELLICGSGGLEIIIKDFNPELAQLNSLDTGSDLEVKSVNYPLEQPTDYSGQSIVLEVSTVTNGLQHTAKLHIGSQVSWEIPYEFALQLQQRLLSKNTLEAPGAGGK